MIKMIIITLNDKTKIEYNTFDRINNYNEIIKLNCSEHKLTTLLNKVNKLFSLYTLNNLM
jgi:hypothetical protein